MRKNAECTWDGMKLCVEKFTNKMSVYDFRVLNWLSFAVGVLFASCLPKVTKKLRGLLLLISFVLMIPTLFRFLSIVKSVFKRNWKWIS